MMYGGIITNLTEILGDILLICQNVTVRVCGAWIKIYHVLCSKTAYLAACSGPPLVRDGPLGAPTFVKLAYHIMHDELQPLINY